MSRPIYETEADLNRESEVAKVMEKVLHGKLEKLPKLYSADYALVDGSKGIKAWVEVRCRGKFYPDPFMSGAKYWKARAMTSITGLPFYMVYSFADKGIFVLTINGSESTKYIIGGRPVTDRNDPADQEPMVVFDIKDMKQVAEF
jgi:hypothetical protein